MSEEETLKADNRLLKEFAREIIQDYCWEITDPDGGDIQDLAEKLGLIEPSIAAEEDVFMEISDDVGEKIYRFSRILKTGE